MGVVVDMHRGVVAPSGVDPVDEALEGGLFLVAGMSPPVAEDRVTALAMRDTEEILEAALDHRIAFHVEEDVVR